VSPAPVLVEVPTLTPAEWGYFLAALDSFARFTTKKKDDGSRVARVLFTVGREEVAHRLGEILDARVAPWIRTGALPGAATRTFYQVVVAGPWVTEALARALPDLSPTAAMYAERALVRIAETVPN